MQQVTFRQMSASDWKEVAGIYKQGIDTGNATFQNQIPTWEEWDTDHLKVCRIVAEINSTIVGWTALLFVSNRLVFAGVAEVSVYISTQHRGQKIGQQLLKQLITESEANNIWMLQSGIFPENAASIKIHESLGFRNYGYREKMGKMNGVWRDVVMFERRSRVVGIN
ncbi:MAG: N-acetyltransferase family protein [Bacteroidia bacterium]